MMLLLPHLSDIASIRGLSVGHDNPSTVPSDIASIIPTVTGIIG
ncbi:hypothetical protein NXW70_19940 [Bacteroides fragilis]|uniref:Uncharacterized protein n=1 Tax=Butyricimonas paravirosa TaxID=1472417 RepID=A0A7X5YGS6_9BACT|nr:MULTISPECIES: hypothetical protein [Bacteroidales]MCS3251099.1 hypothetical protein [Bacteroides fragilis]MCS2389165.1 hypothetical protein [Bacteroides thetaiotaomicron]MCU6777991.1 hypothetical protein [Phocaeicola fibrisolvens]MDN0067301.1 hypothetical protein [Bacteroides gallinaceum]MDY5978610.1 hypothetical protein [Phocaeicola plebeius]